MSDDVTRTQTPDPEVTRTRLPVDPDATKSVASPRPIPLNIEVPGFTLQEKLGEGGMGVVFKAVQRTLNRTVALKMVHGGRAAGGKELIRFLAEVEAVAAIEHPHVVRIFESGDA